jgi:hypothetical protein
MDKKSITNSRIAGKLALLSKREKRYLSCADTAVLVRLALAKQFPGVKFSVRSSTYSMGASIDIRWTDGPAWATVDKVGKQFAGSDFDGSIDLKVSGYHWLMPDGTVQPAYSSGTAGSGGYISAYDYPAPSLDAELVSLGANYVMATREYSVEFYTKIAKQVALRYGFPEPEIKYQMDNRTGKPIYPFVEFNHEQRIGTDNLSDRIRQVAHLTAHNGPIVWFAEGREPIGFDASLWQPEPNPEAVAAEVSRNQSDLLEEIVSSQHDHLCRCPRCSGDEPEEVSEVPPKKIVRYAHNRPGRRSHGRQGAYNAR